MDPLLHHLNDPHPLTSAYPSIESVTEAIISLKAQLELPKGTEHFISDIHGEFEAFSRVLGHASGAIRRRIGEIFDGSLSEKEKVDLGALIYAPQAMLSVLLPPADRQTQWYRDTVLRLIHVLRAVSSKYPQAKVRRLMRGRFKAMVAELLYEQEQLPDKRDYYEALIEAIVTTGHARAFIVDIANAIQVLAIDHLHVVGDIFDRGPGAHLILDRLMRYHSVDIQWGNHDIIWMAAAAGNEACMANLIRLSLRYGDVQTLQNGYAISLLPLATFAFETYKDDPCERFLPQSEATAAGERRLTAQMHKAATLIQFKLEAKIIRRRPDYGLSHRLLLDKIDFDKGTVHIEGEDHPLLDTRFDTVSPDDPFALTAAEQQVVEQLKRAFLNSEKLQKHVRFLFAKGSIYKIYNGNLLYHGCLPMDADGTFKSLRIDGRPYAGKALMEKFDQLARQGFFAEEGSPEQLAGLDAMWYLSCGPCSPLFGKEKMATFERYLVDDPSTHEEPRNVYYTLREDEATLRHILDAFGLDPERGHVVNGHVPVIVRKNEKPLKAGGKLIVIDGGFPPSSHEKTGIAGFTLVFNSWGLLLATHHENESVAEGGLTVEDVSCTTEILENRGRRIRIKDTDLGREIRRRIKALMKIYHAYEKGQIEPHAAQGMFS